MKKYAHIAVLKGGWSPEREVSLVSGAAAAQALAAAGYRVTEIDAGRDVAAHLAAENPDAVFNALHGQWGEDGCVQGLLEVMGLPYTHSGVLASSLAMDKQRAKAVFEQVGIRVPAGRLLSPDEIAALDQRHPMAPTYVIKPNNQGSSVGIHIIRDGDNRPPRSLIEGDETLRGQALVETFIPGRELTVAVLGDRPLCVTEILPKSAFYDYEAKYAAGGSDHQLPADLPTAITEAAMEMALTAHRALGCRGLSRADFRLDGDDVSGLYCLEVNTQPGLTPTSLAPEQAAHQGMSFEALVDWMVEDASCQR